MNRQEFEELELQVQQSELPLKLYLQQKGVSYSIYQALKITNQSKNRQKYITSLIAIGVLERTIPEKPNDPNQKYRRKK